jgi:hypothetical protein
MLLLATQLGIDWGKIRKLSDYPTNWLGYRALMGEILPKGNLFGRSQ